MMYLSCNGMLMAVRDGETRSGKNHTSVPRNSKFEVFQKIKVIKRTSSVGLGIEIELTYHWGWLMARNRYLCWSGGGRVPILMIPSIRHAKILSCLNIARSTLYFVLAPIVEFTWRLVVTGCSCF
jgi:hypothetical protein